MPHFQYQALAVPVLVPAVVVATGAVAAAWSAPPPRVTQFQYQAVASTPVRADVGVDNWGRPFSEPIFAKRRFQHPAFFADPAPVAAAPTVTMGWLPLANQPRARGAAVIDLGVSFIAQITITEDMWHQPWSVPRRDRQRVAPTQHPFVPVVAAPPPDATGAVPVAWTNAPQKTQFQYQYAAAPTFTPPPPPPAPSSDSWDRPWSEPVRVKKSAQQSQVLALNSTTPAPAPVVTGWLSQDNQPRRGGFAVIDLGASFIAEVTVTEDMWHQPWSSPQWGRPRVTFSQQTYVPVFAAPVAATGAVPVSWGSTPVRGQFQYQAYTQPAFTPAPTVAPDLVPSVWGEPVRQKRGLGASYQLFTAQDTNPPTVSFGWYANLSTPVRLPKGIKVQYHPFFTNDLRPVVSFGWAWVEQPGPVRQKKGLLPVYQQVLGFDPYPIVNRGVMGWYNWFSEPVRLKPGLPARLQVSFTGPERVIANPVFISMVAVEDNRDIFRAAVDVFVPEPPVPSQEGASVTIVEVPVLSEGAISIREP